MRFRSSMTNSASCVLLLYLFICISSRFVATFSSGKVFGSNDIQNDTTIFSSPWIVHSTLNAHLYWHSFSNEYEFAPCWHIAYQFANSASNHLPLPYSIPLACKETPNYHSFWNEVKATIYHHCNGKFVPFFSLFFFLSNSHSNWPCLNLITVSRVLLLSSSHKLCVCMNQAVLTIIHSYFIAMGKVKKILSNFVYMTPAAAKTSELIRGGWNELCVCVCVCVLSWRRTTAIV